MNFARSLQGSNKFNSIPTPWCIELFKYNFGRFHPINASVKNNKPLHYEQRRESTHRVTPFNFGNCQKLWLTNSKRKRKHMHRISIMIGFLLSTEPGLKQTKIHVLNLHFTVVHLDLIKMYSADSGS